MKISGTIIVSRSAALQVTYGRSMFMPKTLNIATEIIPPSIWPHRRSQQYRRLWRVRSSTTKVDLVQIKTLSLTMMGMTFGPCKICKRFSPSLHSAHRAVFALHAQQNHNCYMTETRLDRFHLSWQQRERVIQDHFIHESNRLACSAGVSKCSQLTHAIN